MHDASEGAGDTLRILFDRSSLPVQSLSRFNDAIFPLSLFMLELRSTRLLLDALSSPYSNSEPPVLMSKYRTPPQEPSFHWLPWMLSPEKLSVNGTSRPTQGPCSPATSPMYRAKALKRLRFKDMMQGMPISSVAPRAATGKGSFKGVTPVNGCTSFKGTGGGAGEGAGEGVGEGVGEGDTTGIGGSGARSTRSFARGVFLVIVSVDVFLLIVKVDPLPVEEAISLWSSCIFEVDVFGGNRRLDTALGEGLIAGVRAGTFFSAEGPAFKMGPFFDVLVSEEDAVAFDFIDVRDAGRLMAVDGLSLDESAPCRLASEGASEGVVDAFEALRARLAVVVPVVLAVPVVLLLRLEVVDAAETLLVVDDSAIESVFAVWKVVDPSLLFEAAETDRGVADGARGRNVEGPGPGAGDLVVLRVEACDLTDGVCDLTECSEGV